MDTNKNSYTIIYAIVMVVIVALALALVSGALKNKQKANEELDKKKQILSSLNILESQNFEDTYNTTIEKAIIVNSKGEVVSEDKEDAFNISIKKELSKKEEDRQFPVYIANVDGETKYVLSLHGAGLWGAIWGYVALNQDKNSIYGVYYSHEGETPGLGAEIEHKQFQNEFIGKSIFNADNQFVSVAIVKPGQTAQGRDYVDGISGGTITSKGVEQMLLKGIGEYEAFLKNKNEGGNE